MGKLPPLNALRAFEAAGRLRSIRRAAEELAVTPGAVSRQVQSLEAFLRVQLFQRTPRALALTPEGEAYLAAVTQHLDGLREATGRLMGDARTEIVRVQAYTTIAVRWLIPRLTEFHDANPTTEVRLTTALDMADFARDTVDGAIRYGDGSWTGVEVERLIRNEIVPLCTPAFRRKRGLKSIDDLRNVSLLHSLVRPDDWRYWLEAVGADHIDPYAGDKFASSILAYQAVLEGQGIMMAQRALFLGDIRARRLVQPFRFSLDRGAFTYYFVYPRAKLRKPTFRRFRDWLLAEASEVDVQRMGASPTVENFSTTNVEKLV